MKRTILLMAVVLLISNTVTSQNTYVPDDNFEQALIDLGYDSGVLDDFVPTVNIESITFLNLDTKSIRDLTGIEDFVNLQELNVRNNTMRELDFSQNLALNKVNCSRTNSLRNLNISKNIALTDLDLNLSHISNIDLSKNQNLKSLNFWRSSIASIDLRKNVLLETLNCGDTSLTTLDLTQNILLEFLECGNTLLTTLDLSQNKALSELGCFNTPLTNLDLTQNKNLITLYLSNNRLAQIDLSENTLLRLINLSKNELSSLDLSNNSNIENLNLSNNDLSSLDLRNGNNENIQSIDVHNNPHLYCAEVDDEIYSSTNWNGFFDSRISFRENCVSTGNLTHVPDDNFEQALIDMGYDNILDDFVLSDNISSETHLFIENKNIIDLTGIEGFLSLELLFSANNNLSSIDLSQNLELERLFCENNQLTALDLSQNSKLMFLTCDKNQLTSLDLSQNMALYKLTCTDNGLTNLVINSPELRTLDCRNNLLTSLNLDQLVNLTEFSCDKNNLVNLDLTNNITLIKFDAADNELTSLNIKNGHNSTLTYFRTVRNPNLTCIEVDDVDYSTTRWTIRDPGSYFSQDCSTTSELTYIPDDNFEQALIDLGYDDVLDDYVVKNVVKGIIILDISEKEINDLTGLEDFTALKQFDCSKNNLITLDLSQNPLLLNVKCFENNLTTLNVSHLVNLNLLWCASNNLKTIDLSNLVKLRHFDIQSNKLTSLDVSQNLKLSRIDANSNQLTEINIFNNTDLAVLYVHDNQLVEINLNNNLIVLGVNNNKLTALDVSNHSRLEGLHCENNELSSLNIKNGNNLLTANYEFTAYNNSNLICIEVDDAAYSTTNWTNIDPQTSFSQNCSGGGTGEEEACVSNTFSNSHGGGEHQFSYTNVKSTILDFDYLDNSFQLEINGVLIHDKIVELENDEFNASTDVHLTFADNSEYEDSRFHEIYRSWLPNSNGLPRLRVIIDADGNVTMLGARTTISTALEGVITEDGSLFNNITFLQDENVFNITNINEPGQDGLSGKINIFCNDPVPEEACVSNTFVNGNKGGMHEFIYSDVNSTILDFEYLDNSFQLEINGTLIHNKIVELENDEFNASTDVHLKFADNTGYENLTRFHEIYRCWLPNTNSLPRLRVIINADGNVTMLGTRSTIATELEEIVTEDGSLFNTVAFSSNNNVFRITNIDEIGKDRMSGVINIFCTSAENTKDEYVSLSKNSETITMYPNPAKNNVTISINEEATYFLVNLSGQVLRKGRLTVGTNELNISRLTSGLYFLNIKTVTGITSKKLIKQ